MKARFLLLAAVAAALAACGPKVGPEPVGKRADALDASAWDVSQWISVVDAPARVITDENGDRAADGASWFLSTVKNGKKVTRAVWMTAGLGVYDLYVNGRLVGEEVLKPGFTHFAKTKRSFTYDITDAFVTKAGKENVLSAQVTPGWWADKIVSNSSDFKGKKCAFRSVLELTYADGTTKRFGTDTEHWTAGIAGPVKHAAIFDGEEYDARELPGFDTPEKLSTPEVNTEFAGEILPSAGAEIYQRKDLALKPVKTYVWEGVTGEVASENKEEVEYGKVVIKQEYATGEPVTLKPGETLVVDFGQNAAAVPSFVFQGKEGTLLVCRPSEILNDGNGAERRGMDGPEGSTHRRNLRVNDNEPRFLHPALHVLRLPLHLGDRHRRGQDPVHGVRPGHFHRPKPGDRHARHGQRGHQQADFQHALGAAVQLSLRPDGLPAAERAAGLDGRYAGVHRNRHLLRQHRPLLPQVDARHA